MWEKTFQTKFDILFDKIQKNTMENFTYIKKELEDLHNALKLNKQIDACSSSPCYVFWSGTEYKPRVWP